MLDGIKQLTLLLAEGVEGAAAILIGLAAIQAVLGSLRLFLPGIPVRTTVNAMADTPTPVLVVEIMPPSNQAETWINVWTYTMMPSVQEVAVFHTTSVRADLLRRREDGAWPDDPERVKDGDLIP